MRANRLLRLRKDRDARMTRGLMIAAPSLRQRQDDGDARPFARVPAPRRRRRSASSPAPTISIRPFTPRRRGARASISIPGPWRPSFWRRSPRKAADKARSLCAKPRWVCSTAFRPRAGARGASADVAAALGMPVLLVIDVSGQAQSAAAIVKGCAAYDARLKVAGVIVNRVGSERHRRLVVEAIEAMGVPVVGALPRNEKIALPERHLGLVQAGETEALEARLEAIADFIEAHVDCARVLALAGELELRFAHAGARRSSAAGTAHRARARRGVLVHLPASRRKAGGRRGPRSSPSRRSPTSRRLRIATCAGFRAAIRNCTPGGWRRRRAFAKVSGASPRRARCMANAGAIWRSAKASLTPRASPIRWRACSASRRASKSAA